LDIRSSSVDWFKVYSPQITAWYNDLTITSTKVISLCMVEFLILFFCIVAEAKNMPAMDINGFSDCYCILCCEHEYARTSTIDKNLNPYWGEVFSLYIFHFFLNSSLLLTMYNSGIDNIREALLKIYILDQDLLTNDGIVQV